MLRFSKRFKSINTKKAIKMVDVYVVRNSIVRSSRAGDNLRTANVRQSASPRLSLVMWSKEKLTSPTYVRN